MYNGTTKNVPKIFMNFDVVRISQHGLLLLETYRRRPCGVGMIAQRERRMQIRKEAVMSRAGAQQQPQSKTTENEQQ